MKLALLIPVLPLLAYAQGAATLSGRVLDRSQGVVAGAQVHLAGAAAGTSVSISTNSHGLFVFPAVEPGRYAVTVSKEGFRTVERKDVAVNIAGSVTLDFVLDPGEPSFRVDVTSERPVIERDSTTNGTVIDRQFVEHLPLNGRSFQSLIELAPGVVLTKSSVTSPGQFSVNGQRGNANYFVIDGVAGNVAASSTATFSQQAAGTLPGLTVLGGTNSLVQLDALEEFRVQTSNFAAEYGRAPGGQIVMVTRSGSNRLSGSLFYEIRNEKLDANDWFANAAGRGRAPFRLNQFGGVVSGPVVRNRTFFFTAFEGLRLREPQFARNQVPSVSARQRASGAVRDLLRAFPLPNAPSPFANPDQGLYEASFSNPAETNIFSVKADHNFKRAGNVFFRSSFAPTDRQTRAFANQVTTTFSRTDTHTAGWTWVLRPSTVSEFRANWSQSRAGFNWDCGAFDGAVCPDDRLLFPAYAPRDRSSAGFFLGAFLTGINPPNLTQGRSIGNQQRQLNVVETLTHIRGAHSWKWGADIRVLMPIADFREYGVSYNFGEITRAIDQGVATTSVQALAPRGGFTLPGFAFFAQDTWRATTRMTLNLGLRWEIVPPPRTASDRPIYTLNQTTNLLAAQLAPAGAATWDTRLSNFEPRVGLSYLVSRSRNLVFKSGFGLFHDLGTGQASRGFNSWPYNSVRMTVNAPFPPSGVTLDPLPFNTAPPYSAQFFITDPGLRQPRVWHWSAGFEKTWSRGAAAEVRYVGNSGRKLLFTDSHTNRPGSAPVLNPAIFGNSVLVLTRNLASSDYHALQAQFRRPLARGLQAQLSYTWAKALDNLSDETTVAAPSQRVAPELDRGPADFDIRHSMAGALSYTVWRGWSLDSFVRWRGATPVNVLTGSDLLNVGLTSVARPDPVAGAPLYLESDAFPGGRRINPAAFRAAPAGRQGFLGRNTARGFAAFQWDLSIRKQFRIRERLRWEVRAEAFNVLNRANFSDPPGTLLFGNAVNPAFGVAQQMLNRGLAGSSGFNPLFQAGGPRSLQGVVKLYF